MVIICLRTLIIYVTLLLTLRLMGKRQIGEMQPFEFIITLIIADLACIPMADVSIPLIYGIVAIITIFILHQIVTLVEKSGNFAKRVISGKPSVVINKDGVCLSELKRDNLDIDDLIESMRSAGYFSLDDLDYAIFESNGKLSALEKKDYQKSAGTLPVLVVNDGKINNTNLEFVKLTKDEILQIANTTTPKKIEVLTLDNLGKVYLKLKNKKYSVFHVPLKDGVAW